jgi:ABC-2 type transport system permease protein
VASSAVSVWRARHVLQFLVRRDLAIKYQQAFMGYLWSLIEPLAMGGIYYFVFEIMRGTGRAAPDGPHYILYLLSGIFAYMWINGALGEATGALTGQRSLISTMKVPREIFPIAKVAARFVEFVAVLPVLGFVAVLTNASFSWWLFSILLAVVLQIVFLTGVALLLAAVNVMFRDVERFMRLIQRMIFYGAPILYTMQMVEDSLPPWALAIYQANPIVAIIELHHAAWYPQVFPSLGMLAVASVGSLATLLLGWWVFRRLEPAVLKEL